MTAGVLVVDKPEGPTSHDVVAVARRSLGQRRIGHCGTLDPIATGVLALAVGAATRLVPYLTSSEKEYRATIRFGVVTDTYDRTGDIVSASDDRPTRAAVERVLATFTGEIEQQPPAHSAKWVNGVRAHRLARRRTAIALPRVPVVVHALEISDFDGTVANLTMRVSAGFYVRALAHDLGQALGMGAILERLRRTRAGAFGLADAVELDRVADGPREALVARVVPMSRLLLDVPARRLIEPEVARVRRGQDIESGDVRLTDPSGRRPAVVRLVDSEGRLVALATPGKAPGSLHASVVLD
jgi:tRNA pseudouridine55 synthase